jgi:hypothetical protein
VKAENEHMTQGRKGRRLRYKKRELRLFQPQLLLFLNQGHQLRQLAQEVPPHQSLRLFQHPFLKEKEKESLRHKRGRTKVTKDWNEGDQQPHVCKCCYP